MNRRTLPSGRTWIPVAVVLALLCFGIIFVWINWDYFLSNLCRPYREAQLTPPVTEKQAPAPSKEAQPPPGPQEAETHPPAAEETPEGQGTAPPAGPSEAELQWAELTGQLPVWPKDLLSPRDCEGVERQFRSLCKELDSRPYIQAMGLKGGVYGLLTGAFKDLAMHPPVASGELLRFESITANVFHLFRTLGKRRLLDIRQILVREGDLAEPIAMMTFRWLTAQQKCGGLDNPITSRGLYDYSAYLLNTLGGLGYVYRRPPKIAALTTFYTLSILDQAIQEGLNPHGVDPRPHIRRCRQLMASQELVFRDKYLQVLDDMARRWGVSEGQ